MRQQINRLKKQIEIAGSIFLLIFVFAWSSQTTVAAGKKTFSPVTKTAKSQASLGDANKEKLLAAIIDGFGPEAKRDAALIDKFVTFNLSASCWDAMFDPNRTSPGVNFFSDFGTAIARHGKIMGYGDLPNLDPRSNQEEIDQSIRRMDGKFSVVIQATDVVCNKVGWDYITGYLGAIRDFISDDSNGSRAMGTGWRPRGGQMHIALVATPKVKDISVAIDSTGSKFTVSGPTNIELTAWFDRIGDGMRRGGTKKQ